VHLSSVLESLLPVGSLAIHGQTQDFIRVASRLAIHERGKSSPCHPSRTALTSPQAQKRPYIEIEQLCRRVHEFRYPWYIYTRAARSRKKAGADTSLSTSPPGNSRAIGIPIRSKPYARPTSSMAIPHPSSTAALRPSLAYSAPADVSTFGLLSSEHHLEHHLEETPAMPFHRYRQPPPHILPAPYEAHEYDHLPASAPALTYTSPSHAYAYPHPHGHHANVQAYYPLHTAPLPMGQGSESLFAQQQQQHQSSSYQ
jgi:hypothetical protein